MGNKFSRLSAEGRQESKRNERLAALAAAEDWAGVLAELDLHDRNEERRHRAHRADLDITLTERMAEDGDTYRQKDLMRLGRQEDLDEYIFSRDPEDLPQLVEDYPVCEALKELTTIQRKVLWANAVWGYSTADIAEALGCSVRNVTKHRQRALEKVRLLVTGRKSL